MFLNQIYWVSRVGVSHTQKSALLQLPTTSDDSKAGGNSCSGGICSFVIDQLFQLLFIDKHGNLARHACLTHDQMRSSEISGLRAGIASFQGHLLMVKPSWNDRAWPSWRKPWAPSKSMTSTDFDILATKGFICVEYSCVIPCGCLRVLVRHCCLFCRAFPGCVCVYEPTLGRRTAFLENNFFGIVVLDP